MRTYRARLAGITVLRWIKAGLLSMVQVANYLTAKLCGASGSVTYAWVSLAVIPRDQGCQTIRDGNQTQFESISFIGDLPATDAARVSETQVLSHAIDICKIDNAIAVGGTDVVFADGKAFHHRLFKPTEHPTPAYNTGVMVNLPAKNAVRLNVWRKVGTISSAASLLSPCSANYAHWITEVLPKMVLYDKQGLLAGSNILVEGDLHPNIYESLDLICTKRYHPLRVKRWTSISVKNLMVASPPAYERYSPLGVFLSEPKPFAYSYNAESFKQLRSVVLTAICYDRVAAPSERVYLARSKSSSNLRQICNANLVEEIVSAKGFRVVRPEILSFREQVQSVSRAKVIISPVGAALANAVFAQPACHVIVLAPWYEGARYDYWAGLLTSLGHKTTFVLGRQSQQNRHPMHCDYTIDTKKLSSLINDL